jgi:hypothetical protein
MVHFSDRGRPECGCRGTLGRAARLQAYRQRWFRIDLAEPKGTTALKPVHVGSVWWHLC